MQTWMFANLARRDLTGAQLQWANCRQALLEDADLSGAEMSDADFSGVRASKCKFRGATMPAILIDADLEEADLTEAIFSQYQPDRRKTPRRESDRSRVTWAVLLDRPSWRT